MAKADASDGVRRHQWVAHNVADRHENHGIRFGKALALTLVFVVFSPLIVPVVAHEHIKTKQELARVKERA